MHHVSAKFNYFIPKRGPDSKICIFGMYVEFSYFDAVWFFEFIVLRAFGYTSTNFLFPIVSWDKLNRNGPTNAKFPNLNFLIFDAFFFVENAQLFELQKMNY